MCSQLTSITYLSVAFFLWSLTNHHWLCQSIICMCVGFFSLLTSVSVAPCTCLPACCVQPADGAGAVRHHHPGQQRAQAGARPRPQDRHLWLEEALPLPVCPSAHHHPDRQLRPHHLDAQGDVVQHGTHDSPWLYSLAGIVFTPSFSPLSSCLEFLYIFSVIKSTISVTSRPNIIIIIQPLLADCRIFIWVYICIHFFLVGRDGPPASPLRWGQAGGGRVGVSLTRLCSGDPLQRSKIIRNTHFSCSSSHILQSLFSSHSTVCFPPSSVFFKALPENYFAKFSGPTASSLFTKLECELDLSRLHVLLSDKSNSSSSFYPAAVGQLHVSDCAFFGRCVWANWSWQSHTVRVVLVQWAPH